MSESSTSRLFCRDCETEIFRQRAAGRAPERCAPCRTKARRAIALSAYHRRAKGVSPATTVVCVECGVAFDRPNQMGVAPERCPPCVSARAVIAGRQSYERIRAQKPPRLTRQPRSTRCDACGIGVVSGFTGLLRRFCETCTSEHNRRKSKEWRENNPLAWSDIWKRSSARRRARRMNVGARYYKASQIYERDGWRCQLCQGRISRRLKYPNPMSASIDHTIPLCDGGPDAPENVTAAHLRCNLRKNRFGGGEQLALIG